MVSQEGMDVKKNPGFLLSLRGLLSMDSQLLGVQHDDSTELVLEGPGFF